MIGKSQVRIPQILGQAVKAYFCASLCTKLESHDVDAAWKQRYQPVFRRAPLSWALLLASGCLKAAI